MLKGVRTIQRGASRPPLWVASLYGSIKYINILVENLYTAIGIFNI